MLDITLSEFFSETDEQMLSARESELVSLFRDLPDEQRSLILALCRNLLGK